MSSLIARRLSALRLRHCNEEFAADCRRQSARYRDLGDGLMAVGASLHELADELERKAKTLTKES